MTLGKNLSNKIKLYDELKKANIIKDQIGEALVCQAKRDALINLITELPNSLLNQEIPKE